MRHEQDTPTTLGRYIGLSQLLSPGQLTVGFILPLAAYPDAPAPTMRDHAIVTNLADDAGSAGFSARDVPMYDPSFGDTGQLYEP